MQLCTVVFSENLGGEGFSLCACLKMALTLEVVKRQLGGAFAFPSGGGRHFTVGSGFVGPVEPMSLTEPERIDYFASVFALEFLPFFLVLLSPLTVLLRSASGIAAVGLALVVLLGPAINEQRSVVVVIVDCLCLGDGNTGGCLGELHTTHRLGLEFLRDARLVLVDVVGL